MKRCRAALLLLVGLESAAWSTHAFAVDDAGPQSPSAGVVTRSEEPAGVEVLDSGDSAISREEWRERIDRARQRAAQARRDWRFRPPDPPVERDSPAKIATERVLRDSTLSPGDIVATDKGMFVFRGWAKSDGETGDFSPLPRD